MFSHRVLLLSFLLVILTSQLYSQTLSFYDKIIDTSYTDFIQQFQDMDYLVSPPVDFDTIVPPGFFYPKLFTWYYANIPGLNSGTAGVIFYNNLFYFNKWNSPKMLYRYSGNWTGPPQALVDSMEYHGQIRDLATDGTYLYGGTAGQIVYKMDSLGIAVDSITLSGGTARGLSYSPQENVFYACDFNTNITVHNANTGELVRTLQGTSSISGKYGLAYINIYWEGPRLFVWAQTVANNILWILNPSTGVVRASFEFWTPPFGGLAGGAEVSYFNTYHPILLLNYQNFAVQAFHLGAVPVELKSFTALVTGMDVKLNWVTATELNNRGFIIERQYNNSAFIETGFIHGNGTSTEEQVYSFEQKIETPGKYKYRLKQLDFDGTFEYSDEVEIDAFFMGEYLLHQNYPNPFNPTTTITFSIPQAEFVVLSIYDILGNEVSQLLHEEKQAGVYSLEWDASALAGGVYFLKLQAGEFISTKKLLLVK